LRLFVALHFDDDAHSVAVALVADIGDAVDFLVLDQVGDVFDQPRLVYLVGSSVTTMSWRSLPRCSMAALARTWNDPRPVV